MLHSTKRREITTQTTNSIKSSGALNTNTNSTCTHVSFGLDQPTDWL